MSAGEQAVVGSATNGDEAVEAEDLPQVETQQAERGGEGVLRRTRTIVLDLEMGATAGDAAEVRVLVRAASLCVDTLFT